MAMMNREERIAYAKQNAAELEKGYNRVARYASNVQRLRPKFQPQKRMAKTASTALVRTFVPEYGRSRAGIKRGRGRPQGTFKHGIPIQEYKRLRTRQRQIQRLIFEQRMAQSAVSPEELQRLPPEVQAVIMQQQQPQQPRQYQSQPQYARPPVYQYARPLPNQPQPLMQPQGGQLMPPASQNPPMQRAMPQQGYTEDVDYFTGRRFLRPQPKKESWVQ